jgi:hypothetical protein
MIASAWSARRHFQLRAAWERSLFLHCFAACRRLVAAPGGFVGYCTTFILVLTLLANFAVPGAITFLKIFLSFALFVCLAVAVLHFFGRLVIELFGILDGRSSQTNHRYARN